MDESAARRVLLAHAIETSDAQGALLSTAERDQVDLQARQDAMQRRDPMPAEEFIALRAQRVLAQVAIAHPQLAALQEPRSWQAWIEWVVPLVAFVTGVATDAIGNPHRVDLVSLPLLGIVAWNFAMYLFLLLAALWPRKRAGGTPWLARLGRWTDRALGLRRDGPAAVQAAGRFQLDWFRATQPLHVARVKRVLHLSAAAWALGVILSLLVRGLVVEYRVGWESTFLGPAQVYAVMQVLRWPALVVANFEDFTVFDIAQLRFSDGGGAQYGAYWVWLYAALLLVAVILPRLVLATFCAWREARMAAALPLDLQTPYFARIRTMLNATRVTLGLVAHRADDRERFLRVIAPEREQLPVLVSSPAGDVLRLVDIPLQDPPDDPPPAQSPGWAGRVRAALGLAKPVSPPGDPQLQRARDECDVVVHLAGMPQDAPAAQRLLHWLGKPVVTVDMGQGEGLRFDGFARNWIGDRVLLDAIAQALPADRRAEFDHVVRAWEARSTERLQRSMAAVADHLLFAARQVEEVHTGPLSMKSLLPAEREAQADAQQRAMERVAARVEESAQAMAAKLRRIHGVSDESAAAIEHRLGERFVVQQPVHASQAGMAGAATGAAMGASVDLLAGGLTLGAAAALGALVGGGAAFIAAAWKNRASPTGATLVQLSDEMLEALAAAALLRYVAVVHWARGAQDISADWKAAVAKGMQAHRPLLAGFWNAARVQPNPERLAAPLTRELEAAARAVLKHISP